MSATSQVLEEETEESSPEEKPGEVTEKRRKYEFIEDIPGVGPATAEKLKEMGFHTVESLATATIKELTQAGVGEKQAAKVISEARDGLALSFIRAMNSSRCARTSNASQPVANNSTNYWVADSRPKQ